MIGVDLIYIPTFSEKMKNEALMRRMFTEQELTYAQGSAEKLAGMCAAKEAYFKAIRSMPNWQEVEILHQPDGSPVIQYDRQAEVSISHDGDYVVAVVVSKQ